RCVQASHYRHLSFFVYGFHRNLPSSPTRRSSDLVSWIKHSVDRFVIVSIFIPKLRLILILNSFLGSSDSLVFSELFHDAEVNTRSEERFSRNAETELVCRLLLEKKKSSVGMRVHT